MARVLFSDAGFRYTFRQKVFFEFFFSFSLVKGRQLIFLNCCYCIPTNNGLPSDYRYYTNDMHLVIEEIPCEFVLSS